jgi:hypothetical protein
VSHVGSGGGRVDRLFDLYWQPMDIRVHTPRSDAVRSRSRSLGWPADFALVPFTRFGKPLLVNYRSSSCVVSLALLFAAVLQLAASDHSDVPSINGVARQDANLTDLHAFTVGDRLVIALSMNPAIPPSASSYIFPSDITFEINIDQNAAVSQSDPYGLGGTILDPERIHEDVTFRINFGADEQPRVKIVVHGAPNSSVPILNFFSGLRDDPFIRGPRIGRNVASIVLEVPLAAVAPTQSTLLIWATAAGEDAESRFQDLAGRALRSMFPENNALNMIPPRLQQRQLHVPPDVMIYDTARPAAFPNGRALVDDVVDLVGDQRVLANDFPFPSANDVPFLSTFPYLAPPHPPQ